VYQVTGSSVAEVVFARDSRRLSGEEEKDQRGCSSRARHRGWSSSEACYPVPDVKTRAAEDRSKLAAVSPARGGGSAMERGSRLGGDCNKLQPRLSLLSRKTVFRISEEDGLPTLWQGRSPGAGV
jgi:hypothetical protein